MPDEPAIAASLAPLLVDLDQLDPLEGNPRRGDVDAVMRSYQRFGQRKPIVARHRRSAKGNLTRRGEVTAGNTQLAAARELGWSQIAVVWADDDDLTARAWALADNRTSEIGSYDEEALLAYLEAVRADGELLAATSYSEKDLANLLRSLSAPEDFADLDPDALGIDHRCPSCGYEWSGKAMPEASAAAVAE